MRSRKSNGECYITVDKVQQDHLKRRGQDFLLLVVELELSDVGEERESNSEEGWLVDTENPQLELAVEVGEGELEDI